MKKIFLLCTLISLAGCASHQQHNSTSVESPRLGTIIDKQTMVNQVNRRHSPIDIGLGIGGGSGHVGWGINLGLGALLGLIQPATTTETVYRYNIKLTQNESIGMQSDQDLAVGSCVSIGGLNERSPRIIASQSCLTP